MNIKMRIRASAAAIAILGMTMPVSAYAQTNAMTSADPTDAECADIMAAMGGAPAPQDVTGSGKSSTNPDTVDVPEGDGTGGGTGQPDNSQPGSANPSEGGTPAANPTPEAKPDNKAPVVVGNANGSGPGGRVVLPNGDRAKCLKGMKMTQSDQGSINRAKAAKATLQAAAKKHGIDWRILAAIGVRESQFRNVDNPDPGDPGQGVFQLTRQKGVTAKQAHDLAFSANYAAQMIANNIRYMKRKFPKFNQTQVVHAAIAAYNFGTDDISGNPETIDVKTTGHDKGRPYGESVLLAANCF